MMADRGRRRFCRIGLGGEHDFLADQAMLPDEFLLGLVQGRGLAQYPVRNAQFSDVVEAGRNAEHGQFIAAQGTLLAQLDGQFFHPLGMQPGWRVAIAERDEQGVRVSFECIDVLLCHGKPGY
jgi:hypothetical protein